MRISLPTRQAPVCGVAIATLLVGCQADEGFEPLSDSSQAVLNGSQELGYDAVVALTVGGQTFCTGTLIAPRVVLSAAHCTPKFSEIAMSDIRIAFGSNAGAPIDSIGVVETLPHPRWEEDSVANDIGLFALEREAPVMPAALPWLRFDSIERQGTSATVIGFGISNEALRMSGYKRSGQMQIISVGASTIELEPTPSATCNGDSGGPLMIEERGAMVVAGIHARSDCHTAALNERVDRHISNFIQPFVDRYQGRALCAADDRCDTECAAIDPDCVQMCDDGMASCPAQECIGDGACNDTCVQDVDCACADGSCFDSADAGCRAGGPASPLALLCVFALVLGVRRRTK